MDMVMPGGRHIYLRAASMSERQQWLLALGVAKQGGVLPEATGMCITVMRAKPSNDHATILVMM